MVPARITATVALNPLGKKAWALLGAVLLVSSCGKTRSDSSTAPLGDGGPETCAPPSLLCGGQCTDIASDPSHCGACGEACPAGDTCVKGACTSTGCPAERHDCGGLCVHLPTNPMNCGSCNTACPPPETCSGGSCECAAPGQVCGGVCTDTAVSAEHCGACDNPCAADEMCTGGICQPRCPAGLTFCGGRCADLANDRTACGSCENACRPNETCSGGLCVCPVSTYTAICGDDCADLQTDANHCGACGNACAADMRCDLGTCSDCYSEFFFCPSPSGDPLETCVAQARSAEASAEPSVQDVTPAPLSPNLECQCNNCLLELQDCLSDSQCISGWQCGLRNACTAGCWDGMGVCAVSGYICSKFCSSTSLTAATVTRLEALLRCTLENSCGM